MDVTHAIDTATDALRSCHVLLITAGAGMGVDSGLPDFRGDQGFWKAYPPIAKLGISFVDMANPYWFEKDPALAWAFYGHRLNLYRKTVPHKGFGLLLKICEQLEIDYFVFTSNVDGQFQKAGFNADKVVECHGSINHFQCKRPCSRQIWSAEDIRVDVDEMLFIARDPLPRCPYCGSLARPNILMFGDWNWVADRTDVQQQQLNSWLADIIDDKKQLVIIELGAGEAVATVRYTSENISGRLQARLIRINPRDYDVPEGQIGLAMGAADGIEQIVKNL